MHDPMTVAHEIRYPWAKSRRTRKDGSVWVYRESFLTVWHVDSESDGSDDSCGFIYPKPPDQLVEKLRRDLAFAAREDSEALERQRAWEGAAAWWLRWLNRAGFHHRRKGFTPRQIARYWYDGSFPGGRGEYRLPEVDVLARTIARSYLRLSRPWYRHPRWHIRHWRIQLHPWQKLRRWLFARCGQCGKRFGWNEAPTTYSWSGNGPSFHQGCTTEYERSSAADRLIRETQEA